MIQYTKIDTIFERDVTGNKKLIEGRFRSEAVEFLKDNLWICTEKIDGTNIGIVWDGHSVSFQGRTERSQIPSHLLDKLNELFGGNENEELFEQVFGGKQVVLFGEGYGRKIQSSGEKYNPDGVNFILFDVYFPETKTWLKRDSIEAIAKTFGIDAVPVIKVCTLSEAVEFVKSKPASTIGSAEMEGLVCKPLNDLFDRNRNRIICKIKVVDFVQGG